MSRIIGIASQKELLRNEIMVISNYATSGEVIERQFYIMLWREYKEGIESELNKDVQEFIHKMENSKIACATIKEQEIVRLCNLINNPAHVYCERSESV